jgi:hypothetical protein
MRILILSLLLASTTAHAAAAAELSKGNRLLLQHGLQIQGMVSTDDPFHLETYRKLNYTAINWLWKSDVSKMGNPPGDMPWARWSKSTNDVPPHGDAEAKYARTLIATSLGDEPELNDPKVRDTYVKWFNDAAKSHPNQILYINNYGGQVKDDALDDFIKRAKPDMISWDVYPFRFAGANDPRRVQPEGACPFNWYADLRRYRAHALANNIPFGLYRQTYHSESEGVRDPSESELRQLTFVALAFNAKYITDFTYNTGATSLFDKTKGGDNARAPLYARLARINLEARNLGKALVRLTPIDDAPGANHTTSIVVLRGLHDDLKTQKVTRNWTNGAADDGVLGYTGFARDLENPDYTDWAFGRNDPYLSGPFGASGVGNPGTFNSGRRGDVFLSWFKPLVVEEDGSDVYLMVTNALADMNADAAQTEQRILLNFGSSAVKFPYDHLQKLDRATGKVLNVPLRKLTPEVRQLDLKIPGGTAELLKFPTGEPFVGVEQSRNQ